MTAARLPSSSRCFSVVLFGFAALVVDIGHADDVHLQGQSAVDAASLAGVRVLANGGSDSAVVTAVKSYVDQNMGITAADWAGCQDPAALGPQIDTDVATDTCISTLTSPIPRRDFVSGSGEAADAARAGDIWGIVRGEFHRNLADCASTLRPAVAARVWPMRSGPRREHRPTAATTGAGRTASSNPGDAARSRSQLDAD